jgi:hypothetical protein
VWWYSQEYECDFLEGETQLVTRDEIDRMFGKEVEPWDL